MTPSIHTILQQYWGHKSFRPLQQEIIESVLKGNDTLAVLPTGGGKSICFQVPALYKTGLCLVVSPLIALMKDQVMNLRKKNITAFAIHSGLKRHEVENVLRVCTESNCRLLYVSPERLETSVFKEWLPALGISLIAVDEAHCISQWGYDFRPSYLNIAAIRKELPGIPVLALTASATTVVQKDICEKLQFTGDHVFRKSFARPNLSYSCDAPDSKPNRVISLIQSTTGSVIVYCKSRRRTKQVSDFLNANGILSGFYHAGLAAEERQSIQDSWVTNQLRCIVCTNAFGMGIDKPDVRTVIHFDVPDCLENYYQEAGRAGRDGAAAKAMLLYSRKEITDLEALTELKFPGIEQIRQIFSSLMNYLQIPRDSGEGSFFDLDLQDFVEKTHFNPVQLLSVFRALDHAGVLSYLDQVFVPSRVMVTATRESLFEFENLAPHLDPLVKTLLRTYEGILDQPVSVSEKQIARLLHQSEQEVKNGLSILHNHRLLKYFPRLEGSKIFLPANRPATADLHIDIKSYEARKENYRGMVRAMVRYLVADRCRSKIISEYFGEQASTDCGACDNCRKQPAKPLSAVQFESIRSGLLRRLEQPVKADQIISEMKEFPPEELRQVIRFLESEQMIVVDGNGFLVPIRNK
jgi:ATP-dependent DNA helicase RecQ